MKTKLVCVWPKGRPWDWKMIPAPEKPQQKPGPAPGNWHDYARKLRAAGWSYRRIANKLGVSHMQVKRVCG